MDGIRRKTPQNIPTPQSNTGVKPATSFQDQRVVSAQPSNSNDRISSNPFFEKPLTREEPLTSGPSSKKSRTFLWFVAVLAFLGAGGMVATNYFSSATIEIVPTTKKAEVNSEFTAVKDSQDGELIFHFMSLSEEKTKEIPATIEKKLQEKASGKVVIYNNYSKDSQRLIKNTRLEATGGKIFRINDSVVVPGTKLVDGKVVPGQAEAVVYADAPGKEYNLGVTDFTIPGFKGDPRYTKFYARSATSSPLANGFSGTVKVPSDEDIVNAQLELKEDLKKSSIEKAQAQIPEGVTFFPGSLVLKYEEVPSELSLDDKKNITIKATVSVFFFDTGALAQKIAEVSIKDYKNEPQSISNMNTLTFSFIDPVDNVILGDLTNIHFRISGEPIFVGTVDKDKLVNNMAGKRKSDFSTIINSQSNIEKANGEIFPIWKTTFPEDPTRISVKMLNNN